VSATRHWIALDDTFSRLLPASVISHAHERLAHRAAALSDIYCARILNTIAASAPDRNALSCHIDELQLTHRALTAAVTGVNSVDADQDPRTVEAD
jgi:hypothetical protein